MKNNADLTVTDDHGYTLISQLLIMGFIQLQK